MTEYLVPNPTTVLKSTSLKLLLGNTIDEQDNHEVMLERLHGDDQVSAIGYRLTVNSSNLPLVYDLPANPCTTLDIIKLAAFLNREMPTHYPSLASTVCNAVAHTVFIWADQVLSTTIGMNMWIKEYGRCVLIKRDLSKNTPYIQVSLIEDGRLIKRLNSRQLKWLLKREPEIIVFGNENDKQVFELALEMPVTPPKYYSIDDVDTSNYHLMPFAQRIGYKLLQVKHDQLLFSKRGTKFTPSPTGTL